MALIDRLKQTAQRLKTEIAVLGLVYRDPRTPWYAKAVIFLVIAQSLSPIDLIPDFIPVLGYLDDLILIPLGIALAIRLVPKDIFLDAREKVASQTASEEISGWWYAGLVIIFWIMLIIGLACLIRGENH
ncbi:MAG: DUF1232 domain-containing protein [Leptolinea sp.]|nr:DUF1232 domain-containing protein [Leptolinea sp.]